MITERRTGLDCCGGYRILGTGGREHGLWVPLDKSEGVVKAQNSRVVFFTALLFRVAENRSSETLTVNQLSTALTNRSFRRVAAGDRRSTSGLGQNVWQSDVTHSLHGGASLVSAGEAEPCKHGTLILFLRRRD